MTPIDCSAEKVQDVRSAELIGAAADPLARDAGPIGAATQIEHHEIASYGCLPTFASLLGRTSDAFALEKTIQKENRADESLTTLSKSVIDVEALAS